MGLGKFELIHDVGRGPGALVAGEVKQHQKFREGKAVLGAYRIEQNRLEFSAGVHVF